jgi:hypothetical protein
VCESVILFSDYHFKEIKLEEKCAANRNYVT